MKVFNNIDVNPTDMNLYITAVTHSSYTNENPSYPDYERLEFLGDAVVDLVVADYLYSNHDESEGEMTKVRASYVCENALYEYSMNLGLYKFIKVGHGEEKEGGKYKKAILSDIFEALMGAIYLDLGYATARKTVLNIVTPYIEDPNVTFFNDYKSVLQEVVQTEKKTVAYELIDEKGPAHDKTFTMEVKIDGIVFGVGEGCSKKEAEQNAAKEALKKFAK